MPHNHRERVISKGYYLISRLSPFSLPMTPQRQFMTACHHGCHSSRGRSQNALGLGHLLMPVFPDIRSTDPTLLPTLNTGAHGCSPSLMELHPIHFWPWTLDDPSPSPTPCATTTLQPGAPHHGLLRLLVMTSLFLSGPWMIQASRGLLVPTTSLQPRAQPHGLLCLLVMTFFLDLDPTAPCSWQHLTP